VQENAGAHPTDSKLLETACLGVLLRLLQAVGLMALWQNFAVAIDQTRFKSSTECPALA